MDIAGDAPTAREPTAQERAEHLMREVRRDASSIALSAMSIAEAGHVQVRVDVCGIGVAFDEDARCWGARVSGPPHGDTARLAPAEMLTVAATFAGVADALNLRLLTSQKKD